jgi:hypothetical protein
MRMVLRVEARPAFFIVSSREMPVSSEDTYERGHDVTDDLCFYKR